MKFFKAGNTILEALISLSILTVVIVSLFPVFIKMINFSPKLNQNLTLIKLLDYTGHYLVRWSDLDLSRKPLFINDYQEGDELEISKETRIKNLIWAQPFIDQNNDITEHYKVSIRLYERHRNNSAVFQVKVWYDDNLDNTIDPSESMFTFSTVLTEKQVQ